MMEEKELIILRTLIKYANIIFDLYRQLENLESQNQKNSILYQQLLEKLQKNLNEEKNIYNYLRANPISLAKIFVVFVRNNFDLTENLCSVSNHLESDIILKRIEFRITRMHFFDNFFKNLKDINYREFCLENELENDLASTIMRFMKDCPVNEYFCKIKYYLAFIYSHLEEDLMQNNWVIKDNLFWGAKMIGEYSNSEEKADHFYKRIKDDAIKDLLDYFLNCFLEYSDEELTDERTKNELLFLQVITRSVLVFASEECYYQFQGIYQDQIQKNNPQVWEYAQKAFISYFTDLLYPQEITLRLKK